MSGSILFVNSYAEPNPIGSNNTPVAAAIALQKAGYSLEMLTLSSDPSWRGPVPDESSPLLAGIPHIRILREGIRYIVVSPPAVWGDRYPLENEWNASVSWAINALKELKPLLVHQWVWQQLSYFMNASVRLKIPTVYSAQDYGLACQRTFLLTGKDKVCNSVVGLDKCSRCVYEGRSWLGRMNELVANNPIACSILKFFYGVDGQGFLAKRNGVRSPLTLRTQLALSRCEEIMTGLQALQVSSSLGRDLFKQFGVKEECVYEFPWFHDHMNLCEKLPSLTNSLVIAYIGRIAPYKGIEVLMESMKYVNSKHPITLKIVGEIDSEYGYSLKNKYGDQFSHHNVEWVGWIKGEDMKDFFAEVHATIIPSICPETGPRTLIESLAHLRPVICTDLPSMNDLIKDGVNGMLFTVGDVMDLSNKIQLLADSPGLLEKLASNINHAPSLDNFSHNLQNIYINIFNKCD